MAPGYVPDVEKIVAKAGFKKVTQDHRGRRHPERDHRARHRRPGRGRWPRARTATSCSTTPYGRCCRSGSSTTASPPWSATRRSTSPFRPRTRSSSRARTARTVSSSPRSRTAPGCAAARRPRRSSCPPSGGPTRSRPATPTSRPPTTARSYCAYLPDVPIHVVAGDEYNMKVTQPVDVFIADKLFQLASAATPEQKREEALPRAAHRQDPGRLRRFLRHRQGHRRAGRGLRRQGVRPRPVDHRHARREPGGGRRRAVQGVRRDRAHRLRRQHRRRAAHRQAGRDRQRDHRGSAEGQLPGPGADRPFGLQVPRRDQGPAAALHLQQLHPRPGRVQPLLLDQGRDGQPHPGAVRRMGRRRRPGELRQPRAHATPMRTKAFGQEPAESCCPPRPWPAPRSTCCSPS